MENVPGTVLTHLTTVPAIVPADRNFSSLPSLASQTIRVASLCLPARVICSYPVPPWYSASMTTWCYHYWTLYLFSWECVLSISIISILSTLSSTQVQSESYDAGFLYCSVHRDNHISPTQTVALALMDSCGVNVPWPVEIDRRRCTVWQILTETLRVSAAL